MKIVEELLNIVLALLLSLACCKIVLAIIGIPILHLPLP